MVGKLVLPKQGPNNKVGVKVVCLFIAAPLPVAGKDRFFASEFWALNPAMKKNQPSKGAIVLVCRRAL